MPTASPLAPLERLLPLVAALLVIALFAPFATQGIDFHHDGIMLKPALDVLSGQALYRDSFSQYGPIPTWLQALALAMHPSLVSVKYLTVAAYSVTVLFLVSAWRTLMPGPLVLASFFVFVVFVPFFDAQWTMHPWSSVFALMFQAIVLHGMSRIVRGERVLLWGSIVGASTAFAFWCRLPVGVVLVACEVLAFAVLSLSGWRTPTSRVGLLGAVLAAYALVHASVLGHMLVVGSLRAWFDQNVLWPKRWVTDGSAGGAFTQWQLMAPAYVHVQEAVDLCLFALTIFLPWFLLFRKTRVLRRWAIAWYGVIAILMALFWPLLESALVYPSWGWPVFVPMVVGVGAAALGSRMLIIRGKTCSNETFLAFAMACVSVGSFSQFYPAPCPRHIFWSLAPAFGVFVWFVWKSLGWRPIRVAILLGLVFVPAAFGKVHLGWYNLSQALVEISSPPVLEGMRVTSKIAREIETLDAATRRVLEAAPDTPIACDAADAFYLAFSLNHWNPDPYYVNWGSPRSEEMLAARWRAIEERRPIVCFQRRQPSVVDAFVKDHDYVSVASLPSRSMEILAPRELVP